MTRPHKAIAATDADGAPIFLIPTSNGEPFKIDAADLSRLCPGPFYWNKAGNGARYVRCMGLDNNLSPARIIAGAGARQIVRYRDGDPSNLRKYNLRVTGGRAKWSDAAFVRPSPEAVTYA